MKCPICNGKGTQFIADYDGMYDIVCYKCKGKGEVDPNEVDRFNAVDVIKVMEMVKKPMTNEEWFCGLSTEEKAEWFGNWHSFSCVFCKHWKNGCVYNHNQVRCAIEEGKSNKELWMEWLKEVHDA